MRLWVVGALTLLGSCLSSGTTVCGSSICPAGTECVSDLEACFPGGQIDACDGLGNGEACTFGGGSTGTCSEGVCSVGLCGDGLVTAPEQCDGENTAAISCLDLGFYGGGAPSCNTDCGFDTGVCSGRCGDLEVNGPEFCDGGPPVAFDCTNFGFDVGLPSCTELCAPAFDTCAHVGLVAEDVMLSNSLRSVGGVGADRIYAVSFDGLSAFDGADWREIDVDANGLLDVAADDGGAWIARTQGRVLRVGLDDAVTPIDTGIATGDFADIWSSGTEVWIAGQTGLAHFDGQQWVDRSSDVNVVSFTAAWGASSDDVYIGANNGLYHWNGATLSPVPEVTDGVTAVSGTGSDNIAVATANDIHRFDGAQWTTFAGRGPRVDSVAVVGDEIFALVNVGQTPRLDHWDGTRWASVAFPFNLLPVAGSTTYRELYASSTTGVRIAGQSMGLYRGFGLQTGPPQDLTISGVASSFHATPDGALFMGSIGIFDVFGGGFAGGGTRHGTAAAWSPSQFGAGEAALSFAGSTNDVYAAVADINVGPLGVYRFDGVDWTLELSDPSISVWEGVASSSRTFAVGSSTNTRVVLFERVNSNWSMVEFQDAPPGPVAEIPGGVVYATRIGDVYIHDNGQTSMTSSGLILNSFDEMYASGPADIYIATGRALHHFDGTDWVEVAFTSESVREVHSVHGTGADDVWLVAELFSGFVVFQFTGGRWSRVDLPIQQPNLIRATERFIAIQHQLSLVNPEARVLLRPTPN